MSTKGRHLSSGLVATSEPASHPSPQEVAVVLNMVEVTGALEEVSVDTITAVLGVTMEGPINPALGVMVDTKFHKKLTAFQKPAPKSPYSLI